MIEEILLQDYSFKFPLEFALGVGITIVVNFLWSLDLKTRAVVWKLALSTIVIMVIITFIMGWLL